ncbi:hypothetical protein MPSEU_000793500 [Mayamaea pseudoterrestris]|nr:hypothetical protein MPSEU_000793500 [Mayamaea pseudoterrestris]
MSFIADLARRGMETQSGLDETMGARVSLTSRGAIQFRNERAKPTLSLKQMLGGDYLITDRPMYGCAHPDLKASDQGINGTFMAAQAYAQEAKNRRDELLAKYGK